MRIIKRLCASALSVILLFSLSGCFKGFKKADTIVSMQSFMTEDYRGIEWNGRHYVPFCAVSDEDMTMQIGIVDGDENDWIFTYKDYPETQWLVEYYHSGLMDGPFLLREESVTEIPEGLYSEYEWNKELFQ